MTPEQNAVWGANGQRGEERPRQGGGGVRVEVQIYGEPYVVRADYADAGRVQEVAARIDTRMRELGRRNPKLSTNRLAVLTALNLADELVRLQRQHRELAASFTRRVNDLERRLHDQS